MSDVTLHKAFRERFLTRVRTGVYSGLKVIMPNEVGDPDSNELWTRLSTPSEPAVQADMGTNTPRVRIEGTWTISCFAPIGEGTKDLDTLVDLIKSEFRLLTADGVTYRVPTSTTVGKVDEGWWQVNVDVPFKYDTIVTGA